MTLQAIHALGRSIAVTADEVDLFTYVYRPDTPVLESPKPYLHPIRTRGGALVSLFRPHDHVWHKGIAWSLPVVGEHNFWGGPTYVQGQYVQLDNNGSATHREMTTLTAAPDRVEIGHALDWTAQAGDPVIRERRLLVTTLIDDDTWALVFETAMTNVSGVTIDFGSPTTKGRENAGYGGLFWRLPRSFTDGIIEFTVVKAPAEIKDLRLVGSAQGNEGVNLLPGGRSHGYTTFNYSSGAATGMKGATFSVVGRTTDRVEISVLSDDPALQPLYLDIRIALERGASGLHSYWITKYPDAMPDGLAMGQLRYAFSTGNDPSFRWFVVDDERGVQQRPSIADLQSAVTLQDSTSRYPTVRSGASTRTPRTSRATTTSS